MKLPKFTIDSVKASWPIWKAVFKSKWNILLIAGIVLAVVTLFSSGEKEAALASIFWGSWLLVHRYIIAYKNHQIKTLIKK